MSEFEFSAEVWRWKGESAWHFITYVLPIKKAVRVSEGCHEGVLTQVRLNVVEQG